MPIITWDETFSVNIAEIDKQHKQLFDITNKLHDAMSKGQGQNMLDTIFNELIDYTKTHFTYEEELLLKHGYSEYTLQNQEHIKLIARLNELRTDYNSGRKALSVDLMLFLKDWLSGHIRGLDRRYSAYLNGKGVK